MDMLMLYPHAKFGGDLPPHGDERGKNGYFNYFLFDCLCFCLIVTLSVCASLGYRRAHCEEFEFFTNIWTTSQDGATFVLELGQNLEIFQNSNDKVCAHDFDHLGEG